MSRRKHGAEMQGLEVRHPGLVRVAALGGRVDDQSHTFGALSPSSERSLTFIAPYESNRFANAPSDYDQAKVFKGERPLSVTSSDYDYLPWV